MKKDGPSGEEKEKCWTEDGGSVMHLRNLKG